MKINTFLKIFFPTTGVFLTLSGKIFLYYNEQIESKTAKLAELVQEKQDLLFKLSGAKREIVERLSDSQVISPITSQELNMKLCFALVLGAGITLALCNVPSINSIIVSAYSKIATLSGIKVPVAKIAGLDSDGNEIVAKLVGEAPGTMQIFFGGCNQEILLGTLLSSCRTSKSNYESLLTECALLRAKSLKSSDAFDRILFDYNSNLERLNHCNSVISQLEADIRDMMPLDITPAEAVSAALDLFS